MSEIKQNCQIARRILAINLCIIAGLWIYNLLDNWSKVSLGPDWLLALFILISGSRSYFRNDDVTFTGQERLVIYFSLIGSASIIAMAGFHFYYKVGLLDLPAKYDKLLIYFSGCCVFFVGAGAFLPAIKRRKKKQK